MLCRAVCYLNAVWPYSVFFTVSPLQTKKACVATTPDESWCPAHGSLMGDAGSEGRRKSDAARKMSGDQGVATRRRSSLMSDDSTCFEDVYGEDGGADSVWHGRLAPSPATCDLVSALGLANMCGLLANDFVFDGSVAAARSYYCPLLETFGDWRVLRMSGCVFAAAGVLAGVLTRGALADWSTLVLLAGAGGFGFLVCYSAT